MSDHLIKVLRAMGNAYTTSAADRIEALEAALRGIAEDYSWVEQIQRTVRAALAEGQDK